MSDLSLVLFQQPLVWQDPAQNRSRFAELIAEHAQPGDLCVVPEMFTTGFTMAPELLAEPVGGETFVWMADLAAQVKAAIVGSLVVEQDNQYFNRLVLMRPDKNYDMYDKRHLFRMGSEQKHYKAGTRRVTIQWQGWRICPQICYDLRFPVWSRNRQDYDLLLYVASWPARRSAHWSALLRARAIENQAYVVGLNRVGLDGNGVDHTGDSVVISPLGEEILLLQGATVARCQLSKTELLSYREKFPAYLDADGFELDIVKNGK